MLGGTAWLGRTVALEALRRGHDVTCLARGSADPPPGATFVSADRDLDDGLAAVADGTWDAVVDVTRHPGHARRAVRDLVARHRVLVSTGNVYRRRLFRLCDNPPAAEESIRRRSRTDAHVQVLGFQIDVQCGAGDTRLRALSFACLAFNGGRDRDHRVFRRLFHDHRLHAGRRGFHVLHCGRNCDSGRILWGWIGSRYVSPRVVMAGLSLGMAGNAGCSRCAMPGGQRWQSAWSPA